MEQRTGKGRFLFFLVVVVLVLFVFAPSLEHVPRDDQISFLYESNRHLHGGWTGVLLGTISYPRSSHYAPGDHLLFRPAFFALLATERWAWGDRLALWQATGIALHLLVLWNLRRLLRALHDDPISDLGVLFFAVLLLSSETIVWQNVNGYLLFAWFLLCAFHRLLLHLRDPAGAARALPIAAGYFTLAAFSYEFGVVAATLAAAGAGRYAPSGRRARTTATLLVPVVLYLGLNLLDGFARLPEIPRAPAGYTPLPFEAAAFLRALVNLPHFWLHGAFFPFGQHYILGQRPGLFFAPGLLPGGALAVPGRLLEALAVGLAGAALGRRLLPRADAAREVGTKPADPVGRAAAAYLALLLAFYTVLVAAGRVVPRGEFYLHWNLAWAYHFWMLLICLLCAGASRARWGLGPGLDPSARRPARWAAVLLAAIIVENALMTRLVNEAFRFHHAPARSYLSALAATVRGRGGTPGRAFAPAAQEDRTGAAPFMVPPNGPPRRRDLFYSEALYGEGVRADAAQEIR